MLNKFSRTLLKSTAVALVFGTAAMSTPTLAQVEGNIAVTNHYVWRGMSQSDEQPSVSGGFDFSAGNFYAGTWAANVEFDDGDATTSDTGYELDFYGGFAGETEGGISYDVGYIYYMYPSYDHADFSEVYFSLGFMGASATYYYLVDSDFGQDEGDANYLSLDYEFPSIGDYTFALHYGLYDIDGQEDDQIDYSLSVSKGDFTLSLLDTDDIAGEEDMDVVLSYGISF